jgi:hypothetical protein
MLKTIDLEKSTDIDITKTHVIDNKIDNFKTLHLNEQVDFIVKKMDIFTNIKVGDKIGKSNNVYYLVETGTLQKIKRWWYSENRNNTFDYLDTEFVIFFRLYRELKEINMICNTKKIANDFITLINGLVAGLYNLKLTYIGNGGDISNNINNININTISGESTRKLVCKIDSIILTLIDLKDDILKNSSISHPMEIQKQINNRLNNELNNMVSIKFSFP